LEQSLKSRDQGADRDEAIPEPRERVAADSNLRADRDLALLARTELRSVRLLLEYLKPELGLQDMAVRHTIVVFGSTRLLDPEIARRRLEEAERAAAGDDDGAALLRARRALELSRYYAIGRELGSIVGRCGEGPEDRRLVIMTGGGPGGMEAANRGAHEVDAASVGLNIVLPYEQEPNPYISPGLSFQFRYFGLRKLHFMLRARALVALPGGYGTLDELFETLCLIQTGKRVALPVVLVGEAFWRKVVDFEFLLAEGMIEARDLDLFSFAESAEETWQAIVDWYAVRGRSVFDEDPQDQGSEEV
jgi:uncharacterized protein (TIGR00730 family)